MKTITFFKRVLASAALVSVCGFACATNNGKQFIHNDTMEGGKLVCREIYAMNDAASGILNPVKMYKYSYDTDQQKTVKSTYAWNIFKNTWETESRTVISRYETETSVEYSVWNKEKGSFDLSKKYIYITDNNNQLIAQYAYKMNSRTNQWILEKDALTPIYENNRMNRNVTGKSRIRKLAKEQLSYGLFIETLSAPQTINQDMLLVINRLSNLES